MHVRTWCDKWLTYSLAGLGGRVHFIAFVTFTLKVAFVVDADLTAGIGVLTLIYVFGEKEQWKCEINTSNLIIPKVALWTMVYL